MPDGSRDCELILEQLRQLRDMHIQHAATVRTEIDYIKNQLSKIEAIEDAIERMKIQDARQAGQVDGVTWALAKVGAFSLVAFSIVGWLITGGGWDKIKDILK